MIKDQVGLRKDTRTVVCLCMHQDASFGNYQADAIIHMKIQLLCGKIPNKKHNIYFHASTQIGTPFYALVKCRSMERSFHNATCGMSLFLLWKFLWYLSLQYFGVSEGKLCLGLLGGRAAACPPLRCGLGGQDRVVWPLANVGHFLLFFDMVF